MCIEIDFTCRKGERHHIEGEWPSISDALDWVRRVFGASDGCARPL